MNTVDTKCKLCKVEIKRKMGIGEKLNGSSKNTYFCSVEHVQEYKQLKEIELEKQQLDRIKTDQFNELDLYIAVEILGNEMGQIVNPYLKKKVKQLAEKYEYEVIKLAFEYVKKDMNYYLNNKEFEDERHKINYIMVIVNSNINDVYKIWKRKKEISYKQSNAQEIQADVMETVQKVVKKEVKKNIMEFLDEEDY